MSEQENLGWKLNAENPFVKQISGQSITTVSELELEAGDVLRDVPVAYKTWGDLNAAGDNVMVICHALSGSADVKDWWGPLLGPGLAFDYTQYFIVCMNGLGSPYGTASPCTINPETGKIFGPEFPLTTIKDDVRLQRQVLDQLGVKQIAVVIGGSMGGMLALEYSYFGKEYVKNAVVLASCAYHSAWGISWGEAQRQSIYSDPKYNDGYYSFSDPPSAGLGAARMSALLTYRSRNSFDAKFGRDIPDPLRHKGSDTPDDSKSDDDAKERWHTHNHGNKRSSLPVSYRPKQTQHYFTAQSYLRYQGAKFIERFDANCYIAITRKLDTHDVARGRGDIVEDALRSLEQPMLIIGVSSDGLFTFAEQEMLAAYIPNASLNEIISPDGHDAFLLEFEQINKLMLDFLEVNAPQLTNKSSRSGIEGREGFESTPVTEW